MTKAFEPYSRKTPISKAKDNYFKVQPVTVYMKWRKKMEVIAQATSSFQEVSQKHSGAMPFLIGNVFIRLDRKTQDKFLKALKRAFQYLATSTQLDDRNRQAYSFMHEVTRKNYLPATDYATAQKTLKDKCLSLNATTSPLSGQETAIDSYFLITAQREHSDKELAEVWTGEYMQLHRVHQQILMNNIQDFFYLLHSTCSTGESPLIDWALSASRASAAQPHIVGVHHAS